MAKASPWRYKAEPYVYASNFFGPESDRFGLANVSWLTGTASWMYVAATQFILGIRPAWEGLEIDPCLPADWTSASVTRTFRGAVYRIKIEKPQGVSKGKLQLTAGGKPVAGNIVPAAAAGEEVEVAARIS
jgi:cellobiose phosphorylase